MNLLSEFLEDPNAKKLERRSYGFSRIIQHLDTCDDGYIIETGISRKPDNWSGDGMSTHWWNWVAKKKPFKVISIDIDESACAWASSQFSSVEIICDDSVGALSRLPKNTIEKTKLLYLDSFDWSMEQNLDSAFHHFKELATVWDSLPQDCLIVIDDRHSDFLGKHAAVAAFFANLGIEPVFCDYQIGWKKPLMRK